MGEWVLIIMLLNLSGAVGTVHFSDESHCRAAEREINKGALRPRAYCFPVGDKTAYMQQPLPNGISHFRTGD